MTSTVTTATITIMPDYVWIISLIVILSIIIWLVIRYRIKNQGI